MSESSENRKDRIEHILLEELSCKDEDNHCIVEDGDSSSTVTVSEGRIDYVESVSYEEGMSKKDEKELEKPILQALSSEVDEVSSSLSRITLSDSDLELELQKLQCPFTWELSDVTQNEKRPKIISRVESKIEEMKTEDLEDTLLRQFATRLVLSYENFKAGNITVAHEQHLLVQNLVSQCKQDETKNGLVHISQSCLAHLQFLTGASSEAQKIVNKIVPYDQLDTSSRAVVIGVRAVVLMEYGNDGTKKSVSYIEEALHLDSACAEWHFLLGKALGRLRRANAFNEIPEMRELKSLEKAVEICCSPHYCIFLAQSYRETAFKVFSQKKEAYNVLKEKLDKMNERSSNYYRKALSMAPDIPRVNIRCAMGFLKLPRPYRDENQVKICIEKSLQMAPNNAMAHHVNGKFLEYKGNIEAAKKAYERSGQLGAYGAYMDLLRAEFETNPEYDPSPLFETILADFRGQRYAHEILCQKGSYFFLKKNDLHKAMTFWLQVMDENPESEKLKVHVPICVKVRTPFSLIKVAVDEARLALQNEVTSTDETLFKRVISIYENTDLLKESPVHHRERILNESEKKSSFNKRGGSTKGQRRGTYHDREQAYGKIKEDGGNYSGKDYHQYNTNRGSRGSRTKHFGTGRVGPHSFVTQESSSTDGEMNRNSYYQRNRNPEGSRKKYSTQEYTSECNWRSERRNNYDDKEVTRNDEA